MDNVINFEEKKKEQEELVAVDLKPMDQRFISILLMLTDSYFNYNEEKSPVIYVLTNMMCAIGNIIINCSDDKKIHLDILESLYLNAKSNIERWHSKEKKDG